MTVQIGDRYRRTFEYEVTAINGDRVTLRDDEGTVREVLLSRLDQLQKIEPPLQTFTVGQTVRRKVDGALYSLGADGFFDHAQATYVRSGGLFTSASFEQVNL